MKDDRKDLKKRLDDLVERILKEQSLDSMISDNILREKVILEYEALVAQKTEKLQQSDAPYLINVSGIPGSGKTTFAKQLLSENSNLLYVSFDEIMESISYYKSDFQNIGAEEAFKRWELPARYFGYELLKYGLENYYPILFDHSNAFPDHIELYEIIKNMGYQVEIRFIDVDLDVAIERAKKRVRFVPENMIRDRHNLLKELNQQYSKIANNFVILK